MAGLTSDAHSDDAQNTQDPEGYVPPSLSLPGMTSLRSVPRERVNSNTLTLSALDAGTDTLASELRDPPINFDLTGHGDTLALPTNATKNEASGSMAGYSEDGGSDSTGLVGLLGGYGSSDDEDGETMETHSSKSPIRVGKDGDEAKQDAIKVESSAFKKADAESIAATKKSTLRETDQQGSLRGGSTSTSRRYDGDVNATQNPFPDTNTTDAAKGRPASTKQGASTTKSTRVSNLVGARNDDDGIIKRDLKSAGDWLVSGETKQYVNVSRDKDMRASRASPDETALEPPAHTDQCGSSKEVAAAGSKMGDRSSVLQPGGAVKPDPSLAASDPYPGPSQTKAAHTQDSATIQSTKNGATSSVCIGAVRARVGDGENVGTTDKTKKASAAPSTSAVRRRSRGNSAEHLAHNPFAGKILKLPQRKHGECDPKLQATIKKQLAKYGKGFLLSRMRGSKAFSNPYMLEKQANFLDIDDMGSMLPLRIWDPSKLDDSMFMNALDTAQRKATEEKLNSDSKKQHVEFMPASDAVSKRVRSAQSDQTSTRNPQKQKQSLNVPAGKGLPYGGNMPPGARPLAMPPTMAPMMGMANVPPAMGAGLVGVQPMMFQNPHYLMMQQQMQMNQYNMMTQQQAVGGMGSAHLGMKKGSSGSASTNQGSMQAKILATAKRLEEEARKK